MLFLLLIHLCTHPSVIICLHAMFPCVYSILAETSRGSFTEFLVGGTCFWGRFSVSFGDGVRWGELASGTESDEGVLEKLSTEAKNL